MVFTPPAGVTPIDRKPPSAPTYADIPAVLDWLRGYYGNHTSIGLLITDRSTGSTYRVDAESAYSAFIQGGPYGTYALTPLPSETRVRSVLREPTLPRNTRAPMIVLTFDDGSAQDGTVVIPLLNAAGVKGCFALNPGNLSTARIPEYMGYAAAGHELMGHSLTHLDQTTLSAAALDNDLRTTRDTIRGWGAPCNNYVYPFGASNPAVREGVRRYYRSGSSVASATAVPPLATFALPRYAMTNASGTTALYRSWADDILAKNGLGVILIHPGYDFNATQQANFTDFVTYAKGLGIQFVTMNQALDTFGNLLEIGDSSGVAGAFTTVDRDGKMVGGGAGPVIVNAGTLNYLEDGTTANNNNTPPSAYANGKISWYVVDNSANPAFTTGGAGNVAGTLMVSRVRNTAAGSPDYVSVWDRQVFYEYGTDKIWTRRATSLTAWGTWSQIGASAAAAAAATGVIAYNTFTITSGRTAWPAASLSLMGFNNGGGGTGGWPANAGTVYTDRTSGLASNATAQWDRQTVYDYYSDAVWQRRATSDTAWTAFVRIDATSVAASTPGSTVLATNAHINTDGRTTYPAGVLSLMSVNTGGFPVTAGVIWTDRSAGGTATNATPQWDRQTAYDYYSDAIWQRRAASDTTWTTWVRVDAGAALYIARDGGTYTAATAPNAFPANRLEFTQLGADATGAVPSTGGGTLITESYTLSNGASRAYTKQMWWPYGQAEIWFRTATSDTAWGTWERTNHSPAAPVTASLSFPSIAANSQASLTITVPGAVTGDNVKVNPVSQIEAGLDWNEGVYSANTVTVTLSNLTAAAIAPAARNWKATVIR
ncbi:polysaccharide deacetylase family protein [Deinococcus radiomollis]|uniref:polysaccharide deacetylase family protein n=1 Tax=Deinococcus radiomollis TaxID=468916 RepID=UPI003892A2C7